MRRGEDIQWLRGQGVRLVVSVSPWRHNLAAYDAARLAWVHVPVADAAGAGRELDVVRTLLRREVRLRGAVAVHGDYRTDFVAAVCAAHLHEASGVDPAEGLLRAAREGLHVSEAACELLGVRVEDVMPGT